MANIVEYTASPILERFHNSDRFVRGIMGPVGSGKSVGCCFEIFIRACGQEPNHNNVRKSRWLVVRNTLPQLETTTMKTWKDWFPPGSEKDGGFGKMTGKPPYTHTVSYGLPDDTVVELEVQFLALDKPEDIKKLLSYECSGIWFNEAREIRKELVDAATARVGRYPSPKDGGCTRKCIIMDTNPPDDSHWWYRLAEEECPENWEFFRQPSGLAPDAENLENLNQRSGWQKKTLEERRKDGRSYYEDMLGGKDEEWVNVYVHGEYGFIKTGQPVYGKLWNDKLHVAKEPLKPNPYTPVYVGVDSSGRHPAAVFIQQTARGQWLCLHELCITGDDGIGATNFAHKLRMEIKSKFRNIVIGGIYGDPAGGWKSQNDEQTYFQILIAHGISIKPSPGFRLPERLEAVRAVLGRMVDGEPAFLLSPTCQTLRKGFNGGYHFKKISTAGDYRLDEKPNKNRYADPHDALQYVLCGVGAIKEMLGRDNKNYKTKKATVRFGF